MRTLAVFIKALFTNLSETFRKFRSFADRLNDYISLHIISGHKCRCGPKQDKMTFMTRIDI